MQAHASARPHAEQKQARYGRQQHCQPADDERDHGYAARVLASARQAAVGDEGDQRDRASAEAGGDEHLRAHAGPLS